MAIFTSIFESNTELDIKLESNDKEYEFDEADTFDDTITEYCKEMYALDAVMYIVDVQLESAVLEGTTESVQTLAENALGDFFKNIADKIKDIWNKVRDWIRERIMNIKAGFAASSQFMKKHGGEVIDKFKKNGSKWKYTGNQYVAGNGDSLSQGVAGHKAAMDDILKDIKAASDKPSEYSERVMSTVIGDIATKLNLANGSGEQATSIAELGSMIAKSMRFEYVTDHVPSESEIKIWVSDCEKAKDYVNDVDKAGTAMERAAKEALASVKKLERDASKNDNKTGAAEYHSCAKYIAQMIAVSSKITTGIVNAMIEAIKAYSSRCKSLYKLSEDTTKKSTKESYSTSLFDNALNCL